MARHKRTRKQIGEQRFATLPDTEMDETLGNRHAEKIKKNTKRAVKTFKGTIKTFYWLRQGSYVCRNSKIQGFPGLFYRFFPGLFQGSRKSRMKTTFTTNCNHYKATMSSKCSDSILFKQWFLAQNEVLKWYENLQSRLLLHVMKSTKSGLNNNAGPNTLLAPFRPVRASGFWKMVAH